MARPALTQARATREVRIVQRVQRHWHQAVPGDRMAHLVKDTMRAFNRALQSRLARHGVQPGHWVFLRVLWQHDGLTQRELSIEAGVMESTTFVALRRMAELGYLELRREDHNHKNLFAWLTPLGKRLRARLVPLAEEVNALALQGLSHADVAVTRRSLLAMLDNLARDAAVD